MPEPTELSSAGSRNGRIVTFYSFKGGTGRTMALANVAWILAANGRRVLVADWDLESPGLHRFFHPFMDTEISNTPGIIDLIRDYERARAALSGPGDEHGARTRLGELVDEFARVEPYTFSLNWEFGDGSLDFLSSGRQNQMYAASLGALDWEVFYNRLNGGEFLDALRADMKRRYDYVLIDSRTGLSDVADICTVHLPDVLVDCFTLSTQGIEGAAEVAGSVQETFYSRRPIRILPVPMRVEPFEKEKVDAGHAVAVRRFAGLPAEMSESDRRTYWSEVAVPYRPFYAYEETLAVFGDAPGSPTSLLSSFERLTGHITEGAISQLPEMDESERKRTAALFARPMPTGNDEIVLDCAPRDHVWADWISGVLSTAGLVVRDDDTGEDAATLGSRVLTVVSPSYAGRPDVVAAAPARAFAVYVGDARAVPGFDTTKSAFLTGLSELQAIEQLCRLLGVARRPPADTVRSLGVRYPAHEPRVIEALARDNRFTGRERAMRQLRQELLTSSGTPVALQGLAGVGKTQIALEYVYRFRSDYDVVWWLNSEQAQFVDTALADLGRQLQTAYGLALSPNASVAEIARQVLRLLGHGQQVERWLLVFDNADEIEDIEPLLPAGNGHVLITSRNRAWNGRARLLPVDVFTRAESVAYLRQRVEPMTPEEANKVADVLGDLPLAVTTASAWLAEAGTSVGDYLAALESRGSRAVTLSQLEDANYPAPVASAWNLSLDRLRDRSPAAARLFELCSVMAPDISLDLLHSQAMADVLVPLDPALVEPLLIGRIIQEINRLALAKLDPKARLVQVHRLVQAVVRDRMTDEELARTRSDVHRVLASIAPRRDVDDPGTWESYQRLWPHLAPSGAMASEAEPVRQLLIDRVRYLWQRGDLDRGRLLAADVESAWEDALAREHDPAKSRVLRTQLLHLRFNLANITRDQARFKESKELDSTILAEQQAFLGPEHPHTLMTALSLAGDLRALGDYFAALEMDKETHRKWTELFSETHPRTLMAANNLAVSYRLTGDYARSLELDTRTFEQRRATLKDRHPQTLSSAINIGRDLVEAGSYKDAAERMSGVYDMCKEVLGADDSLTFSAKVLLGIALRSAGRPHKAEPHFHEALAGLIGRFGDDSSDALACRLSQSANLMALERYADAEAGVRAVLAVYEQRLGPPHPHTLVCRVNLASALRLTGRHDEALGQIRSASEGLRDRLGENHPYTLAAMMVLATVLADGGALAESHELDQDAWERLTRTLGAGHPDALRCHANLLLTECAQGVAGAAQARDQAIDELAGLIGDDHPHIGTLREERRLMRALDPQPF